MAACLFAIAFVSPVLTSCGSDDDDSGEQVDSPKQGVEADAKQREVNTSTDVPSGEDADENAAAIRESQKTALVMRALCQVDTVAETVVYTPKLGKAIKDATPTVYYTTAADAEEAEGIYQSVVSVLQEEGKSSAMPHEVTQGDIQLSYIAGGEDGQLGRIIVDCPRLKNVLSAVVILTPQAWPQNDIATPCNFLSIWYEVRTGRYYICVRELRGTPGVLLTFDGGWGEDQFYDSDWQDDFTVWTNCGLQDHFDALSGGMRNNPTKFKNSLDALEKAAGRSNKTWDLLDDMFTHDWERVFDCDYNWSKGRWWFGKNYYITVRYVKIKKSYCQKLSMYCEHTSWPNKARPSYYKTFNVNDVQDYKDTNKWRCIQR